MSRAWENIERYLSGTHGRTDRKNKRRYKGCKNKKEDLQLNWRNVRKIHIRRIATKLKKL